MGKNLKMGPRAEEKIEKRGLQSGQKVRKMGPKKCRTQHPLKRLIHMYSATKFGRSKSEPFVIDDYFCDCCHQKSTSGG